MASNQFGKGIGYGLLIGAGIAIVLLFLIKGSNSVPETPVTLPIQTPEGPQTVTVNFQELTNFYLASPYMRPNHVHENYLGEPYSKIVIPNGGSLEPFVHEGNTVLTKRFDGIHVEPGNIVFYVLGGTYFVHRVDAVYPAQQKVVTINKWGQADELAYDDISLIGVGVLYS
jgi:hypothetical protein